MSCAEIASVSEVYGLLFDMQDLLAGKSVFDMQDLLAGKFVFDMQDLLVGKFVFDMKDLLAGKFISLNVKFKLVLGIS